LPDRSMESILLLAIIIIVIESGSAHQNLTFSCRLDTVDGR
jgi:hypothetical protein